jgi:hypothetical protein
MLNIPFYNIHGLHFFQFPLCLYSTRIAEMYLNKLQIKITNKYFIIKKLNL